ncbi:MAG: hypothetical protein ABEK84_04305 [Salinibacter sp.]
MHRLIVPMESSPQEGPSPEGAPSVVSRILAVPKKGASRDEYEDAAAVRDETWPVRAAVADGATESVFARSWAETLADGLSTVAATPEALAQALPEWQASWTDALAARADSLPWYTAAKARKGAFAAVLGIECRRDGRWRAVSVGDALLLHLRGTALQRTWPHTAPDDFTSRPALVPSRPDRPAPFPEDYRSVTGTWQRGDAFLLATDAVAAWLLRVGFQDGPSPSGAGPAAARSWSPEAFREVVAAGRAEGHLRNDDSTLLVLEVGNSAASGEPSSP